MMGNILATAIAKRTLIRYIESLIGQAEASGDYTVSVADLTCDIWRLNGWCPYCGAPHRADDCPTYAAYIEDQLLHPEGP